MQIVEKPLGKHMGVSRAQVLSARIADARAAIGSSPQRSERARSLAAHITETVRAEKLVVIAESVVQPDIERILIVYLVLIGQIIISKSAEVWLGVKIGDVGTDLIDKIRGNCVVAGNRGT